MPTLVIEKQVIKGFNRLSLCWTHIETFFNFHNRYCVCITGTFHKYLRTFSSSLAKNHFDPSRANMLSSPESSQEKKKWKRSSLP